MFSFTRMMLCTINRKYVKNVYIHVKHVLCFFIVIDLKTFSTAMEKSDRHEVKSYVYLKRNIYKVI